MHWWTWLLVAVGAIALALTIAAVSIRRSRTALIELVRLVPLCVALLRDVMRDPAVPRRTKIAPAVVLVYLAIPIDLIPEAGVPATQGWSRVAHYVTRFSTRPPGA
jgi:hypothetical protein